MKRKKSILFILAWNDYRIFQGINRYAHQAGWQMDTRHYFLNLIPKDRIFQGLIAMRHNDPAINAYVRKMAQRVPTVTIGTRNPGVKAPMVTFDNRTAGRLAAQHLYDLFHKSFGWFACEPSPSGSERQAAFDERLGELGLTSIDLSCGQEPFNPKTVMHKLRQCPKPIGVMARDDHDAAVLLDLCHEVDLRTPEDVAVVGVGDLESFCAFSQPPVSSINLNMDDVGYTAASVLDLMLQGQPFMETTVVPAGALIQRLSTGVLAILQPQLKKAVSTIDASFREPLTMEALASTAGVSRRQLYNLFLEEMRCSPCDYLLSVRLKVAQQLIEADQLNFTQVAQASGFNNRRALDRVFMRRLGMSPKKWRRLPPSAKVNLSAPQLGM